ncbi:MAG: phosphotransferase [Sciscionella sp.]|nr:phosphotransferase [Sciscionella sp.]
MIVDERARARLVDRFGPGVAAWCDAFPALLASLTRRWELTVDADASGNTGRTLLCHNNSGEFVVLKLTPDLEVARTEATALRAWSNCPHVVDVLDADLDRGALLLAGIQPGTPLTSTPRQLPELLAEIHGVSLPATGVDGADPDKQVGGVGCADPDKQVGGRIITLVERVEFMFALAERTRVDALGGSVGLLRRSREAALELAADGPTALLHGDFHQRNLLDGGARGPVIIDPRPCLGDPAFDAIDWALLPMRDGDPPHYDIPGIDGDRLRRWCECIAVLAAGAALRRGDRSHANALLDLAKESR